MTSHLVLICEGDDTTVPLYASGAVALLDMKSWKIGGSEGFTFLFLEGHGALRMREGRVQNSLVLWLLSIGRCKMVTMCCCMNRIIMRSLHLNILAFVSNSYD